MTLRTRIKQDMIYCLPWTFWKHEIKLLSISAKTLFAIRGTDIDKLEEELKLEGWIHQSESLLEHLKIADNLRRELHSDGIESGVDLGDWPEDWTEEDFLYNGFGIS